MPDAGVEPDPTGPPPDAPGSTPAADPPPPPAAAAEVFGPRLALAVRYVQHLATSGVARGLIGPREVPRLWDRHVLNCAVVAELVPDAARTVDIGSGAGLPGLPLAMARPDLAVVLVEPLARRVDWLTEVVDDLGMDVEVQRGRAEERSVRRRWEGADVVTARAVAPLARLAGWALPLLRPGGMLLAVKGASAAQEMQRDAAAVRARGGAGSRVVHCGADLLDTATTVVVVPRADARDDRRTRRSGGRGQA